MQLLNKKKKGFTLIELIVVIAIISSIMTLGLKLLNSFWKKQSSGVTSLEMMQIMEKGREMALAKGVLYSLEMNMENKSMELMEYDPAWESRKTNIASDSITNKKYSEEGDEEKSPPVLFRSNIPEGVEKVYSISGLPLDSPLIFLHFYPDGTGDSIILKYSNRDETPYFYIPHNGGKGVYFADLNSLNEDEK